MNIKKQPLSIALAVIFLSSAAQSCEYKWGAISLDLDNLSTDSGYGIGGGETDSEEKCNVQKFYAENLVKVCQIFTIYKHCGAVAVTKSGNDGAWGIGDTEDKAKNAISKCDNGKICKILAADYN